MELRYRGVRYQNSAPMPEAKVSSRRSQAFPSTFEAKLPTEPPTELIYRGVRYTR